MSGPVCELSWIGGTDSDSDTNTDSNADTNTDSNTNTNTGQVYRERPNIRATMFRCTSEVPP
jgi:hypothetical protein